MTAFTQALRAAKIVTPLPDDSLALSRLVGQERLSTPFSYRIECISEDASLDLYKVLGHSITVSFVVEGGGTRYINGIVASAAHNGNRGEYALYTLLVKPWIWLLDHTSDCRIFADLNVPDIIQKVFRDNGFDDFDNRLTDTYAQWNHCVQYQETDFSFVSRLMQHEGIYYFFDHEEGKNILVLCDSPAAHKTISDYEEVPHYPADSSQQRERDHLEDWSFQRDVKSSKYAMKDFGFKDPKGDLLVTAANRISDGWPDFELYEYPGAYPNTDSGKLERSYGEQMAKRRMERELSLHEVATSQGTIKGLNAGNIFSLTNCEREDQNREYLIIDARLTITLDSFRSDSESGEVEFHTSIECIDSRLSFRSPPSTPKPLIQGPQTAIVVGPAGEEIWTDLHGRVKLQFHWDRYGKSDENSSRWVRVSQVWAGEKWGAIHIPRIGQEVIVEYIDGDPDRPIVTGRVYNGDRPVPYDLPANATQSGIKSRSSKGGSPANFNEIRMEDKKGSEELYIHAEKNQSNIVENDESTSVGHDRSEDVGNDETIAIGNNRSETVGNDETIAIGNNRSETVGSDETIGIGKNRTENVGANESITIGSNRTEKVGANENVTIGASRSVTIGKNKIEMVAVNKAETIGVAKELSIGGTYTATVGGNVAESFGANVAQIFGGNQTTNVSGNHNESIGKNQSITISDDMTISVGKNLTISAGDSISIVTGSASINMKKDGTIAISGKDITVNGKGAINVKASNNIVMKGKKILQN